MIDINAYNKFITINFNIYSFQRIYEYIRVNISSPAYR